MGEEKGNPWTDFIIFVVCWGFSNNVNDMTILKKSSERIVWQESQNNIRLVKVV